MFKISNSSKLVQKFSNVKVPNFFNKSSFSEIMPTSPSDINLISSVLNKFIYLEKCFRGSLEIIFFVLIFFLELLLMFSEGSGNNSSLSEFLRIMVNKKIIIIGYPKLNIFLINILLYILKINIYFCLKLIYIFKIKYKLILKIYLILHLNKH